MPITVCENGYSRRYIEFYEKDYRWFNNRDRLRFTIDANAITWSIVETHKKNWKNSEGSSTSGLVEYPEPMVKLSNYNFHRIPANYSFSILITKNLYWVLVPLKLTIPEDNDDCEHWLGFRHITRSDLSASTFTKNQIMCYVDGKQRKMYKTTNEVVEPWA